MADYFEKKGYIGAQQQFSHFTFSPLYINESFLQDDRLFISDNRISMILSIIPDPAFKTMIPKLFSGVSARVGDKKSKLEFIVDEVELLSDLSLANEVAIDCSTPVILMDYSNPQKTQYISPEEKGYEKLFFKNLMAK